MGDQALRDATTVINNLATALGHKKQTLITVEPFLGDGTQDLLTWLQEFQILPQLAEDWKRNLPQGKSLIRWCIENQKLPGDIFFLWAKKHYQLPALTERFTDFKSAQEISISHNLWIRVRTAWVILACMLPHY